MNQKNSENMQKFPTNHNVTHNVVRRIFTNGRGGLPFYSLSINLSADNLKISVRFP